MGITYQEKEKIFVLTTAHTEYQIGIDPIGIVQHLYYGPHIFGQNMTYSYVPQDRGFSGNLYENRDSRGCSIDTEPQEFTGSGMGDYRISSLAVVADNGSRTCDLRYAGHEINDRKQPIPGLPSVRQNEDSVSELRIMLEDAIIGLRVTLIYDVFEEKDIITRRTVFENMENVGEKNISLEKASSMSIDFLYKDFDLIHFHGRHCMERQMERAALTHDVRTIASARGMSSHHENPFVILCDKDTTENNGDCYGFMFVYSGNHKTEVELDQAGSTRLVMGINNDYFSWKLGAGESFDTPEVILSYSADGLHALSRNYHRIIRENVCPPQLRNIKHPVLINNWEATYFNFDTEKILSIAKTASEIGIDMFVLDDGWFGKRDDDNSGLGDWFVNESKLVGGLGRVADGVNALGMKFGLWFEPEMINEDSNLFREHPEWVLRDPGTKAGTYRDPNMSRNQLVLDMGNPEVVDYLFGRMTAILDSANIEYVKWDYNRSMANVFSNALRAEQQGEASHRFMLGTYRLLDMLRKRYPNLLIEGCSGGGGRFDAGMLYYCPQIWTSDDTDAVERLKIQHGTSYGYPVSTMGSHVSAVPNHQTGRVTSLHTRGVVAMSGTFGYELDLTKLSEKEKAKVRCQIDDFHAYGDLIRDGVYYRLSNPQKNEYYTAWEMAAEDGTEALLNVVVTHPQANPTIPCIRLQGLVEDAMYEVMEVGKEERKKKETAESGEAGESGEDAENGVAAESEAAAGIGAARTLTGAALMHSGYVLTEIMDEGDEIERGNYPAFMIYVRRIV